MRQRLNGWGVGLFLAGVVASSVAPVGWAADWPQYHGLNRDSKSSESKLLKQWPKDGPPLLWTATQAGIGYAGPAIVGDRLYTCGGREDHDVVFAWDLKAAKTPQELWSIKIGPLFKWKGNSWNAGPNVTPTVDGNLVYALGSMGDLVCVDSVTGKEVWRKNLPKDFGGEVNPIGGGLEEPTPLGWGYAGAPLVDGEQLICVPGGKQGLMVALEKKTGKVIWQSKEVTDQASYSSPIAAEIGGVKQYIQVINRGIVGIAAKDGKLLWTYKRDAAFDDVVITTPIVHDNHVYATVGFQQGCDLIKLTPGKENITVEKVYSNKSVENRDGGVVLVGSHLYGHSENRGWFCQEFKTGKIAWSEKAKLGRGSLVYADGHLICVGEKGGMVSLVAVDPKEWNEVSTFKLPKESRLRLPSGALWTHPVVANGKLYIRDQELIFCFDLQAK